ncbi:SAM-dependent DNA methyltransferase [Paraburkholderia sp. LEh10]|uniref:Eco57I restriction-modification methylase domain-containing protein n=1 Tax=Paraburkholderia sp. LEh10 TaxID=2821353 RepID=UPI001AE12E76|nr:N-6 DNA methylase [Paraburkholderia sp. LEh10]MBP0588718.1 SAM-dependent DNA methyltransferase [Paraburkholderia sp. LEh10]
MVAKRKTKTSEAQLAFEALSINGGLLSPEWLSKVAQLQAGIQAETEYRIPKGLNLRDEIGRYWRIAQAHWTDFKSGLEAKTDSKAVSERFLLALLHDAFGFTSLTQVEPVILAERSYPIGHTALGGRVPIVIAAAASGLDTLASAFSAGGRKRSAFGLAQEYLNAQEDALWGIASDGASLRIVRDNASLTRPAWIEADLQRIFAEERYADFAALWLLCHETRFGREGQPVTACALEAWRNAGREEGTRAREHLRRGVEEALVALGQGFLTHPENQAVRGDLQNGTLPLKDYFNQLLRMVYRLIFLLTVEERALLHPDGTSEAAKALYGDGYGMRRLRERSVKRNAYDRFADLWEATKVVFRGLASGEPRLGLPALAGIFAESQCQTLDGAKLENRALLLAMFKLSWLREEGRLSRVNWRDMGPEELGSVYESLLELVPQITLDGRQFVFAKGEEKKGNARKTTGSYYTPDSLVQVLLDSALEPVIADTIAKNPINPVEALLSLSIVDPACGSGHFLLAAARRLAAHIARLQANGTPSAAEYQHAIRQVVGRCIFGVDLNTMAVELCKVGLWMEAVEPGMPLTFLNSHIQHGNALLGTTPELMTKGIPDAAWEPIDGDDRKTASALKKRNKAEAGGQRTFDFGGKQNSEGESEAVFRAVAELDAASDAKLDELTKKEELWDDILGSREYCHQKSVADAWCAAFVWPKQPGEPADAAPTNELWRQLRDGQGEPPPITTKMVDQLAQQYRFFHWHLQFPQVFAKGGFDVVLGNPPWESSDLMKVEFFAAHRPEVLTAGTTDERLKMIDRLLVEDPRLALAWSNAQRQSAGEAHFISVAGRYPFTSIGKQNTYRTFAELCVKIVEPYGRTGLVLKTGIVNAQDNQHFFASLLHDNRVVAIRDFVNTEGIFPDVVSNERFCSFVVAGTSLKMDSTSFMFCLTRIGDLADTSRLITVTNSQLARLNPNDLSVPPLTSVRDKEILLGIHERIPVLVNESIPSNPLHVRYARGHLNSSTDSGLFAANDFEALLASGSIDISGYWAPGVRPLIEGKLIGSFNHRFGTFLDVPRKARFGKKAEARDLGEEGIANPSMRAVPRYWLREDDAEQRFSAKGCRHYWLLAYRHVCRAIVDARTAQVAIIPREPVSDSCALLLIDQDSPDAAISAAIILASWTSFVGDYVLRQKIYGPALTKAIAQQLPVPTVAMVKAARPLNQGISFILCRVLELTYTAWDLEPFARDLGYAGTPFCWDRERRFLLRCELDAAMFHLYGLSREDVEYVMETFPIVRKNDEKVHREYRTKRAILEIYDALSTAAQDGRPYQTLLDPPPAAPGASYGTFQKDGIPKNYAEALRTGLLFALVRLSGESGISLSMLSRTLVWLQDSKHATNWLERSALAYFEQIRSSDPILTDGAAESKATNLLAALETAKAITQDSKGIVRLHAGGTIPAWLPQTPVLAKLASVLRSGIERAEQGASTTLTVETVQTEKAKRA